MTARCRRESHFGTDIPTGDDPAAIEDYQLDLAPPPERVTAVIKRAAIVLAVITGIILIFAWSAAIITVP